MNKPYNKMTPREHLIAATVSRIKAGRATNPHETIEGIVAEGEKAARAGHLTTGAEMYKWYVDATYAQIGRVIMAVEREVQ